MKFEIGQKVYSSRTKFRNLEVIDINELGTKMSDEHIKKVKEMIK